MKKDNLSERSDKFVQKNVQSYNACREKSQKPFKNRPYMCFRKNVQNACFLKRALFRSFEGPKNSRFFFEKVVTMLAVVVQLFLNGS